MVVEKSVLEGALLQLRACSLQASEAAPRGLMLTYVVVRVLDQQLTAWLAWGCMWYSMVCVDMMDISCIDPVHAGVNKLVRYRSQLVFRLGDFDGSLIYDAYGSPL